MKRTLFCILFMLLIDPGEVLAKSPDWSGGRPGCYPLFRNRALAPSQLESLPEDCQKMRLQYFQFLGQLQINSKLAKISLSNFLKASELTKEPYLAILMAKLSEDPQLIKALEKRATFEKKKNLPFRYASLATELLKGKSCSDLGTNFQHPFYEELCTSRDSILKEIK